MIIVNKELCKSSINENIDNNTFLKYIPSLSYGLPDTGNMIIEGENLEVMKKLLFMYSKKIKCIFIDPPYNSKLHFHHYKDDYEDNEWIKFMYTRLKLLNELMSDDGIIWVTINDIEVHYLKVIMDTIWGRNNFMANVVWRTSISNTKNLNIPGIFLRDHNHILTYAKNIEVLKQTNKQFIPTLWDNITRTSTKQQADSELSKLFPELKSNQIFQTPKPEKLVKTALEISTNTGDIVLDCFLGSGTSAAVAHKMNRRYIGIEIGKHAQTYCAIRLQKVIDGEKGGCSKEVGWNGGGGFNYYRLEKVA